MLHRDINLPVLVLFAASVLAQTSLFIPGFDPQPLSADILGVDVQGRTTWALHAGSPTDTFSNAEFIGTATLVEGPNDASLTYVAPAAQFTIGIDCTLSDTLAVCSATSGGTVATATETVTRFAVQGGTTAPLTSTGSTTPQSSQPSQTSLKTATPSSTSNARMLTPFITLGLFILTTLVAVLI